MPPSHDDLPSNDALVVMDNLMALVSILIL